MRARLPQQAIPTSRVALRTPSAVIAATRCGSRAFMVRDNGHRPRAMAVPHHEDNHRIPRMGLPATIYNPHDVPKRSKKRSFARCVNLTAACGARYSRAPETTGSHRCKFQNAVVRCRIGVRFGRRNPDGSIEPCSPVHLVASVAKGPFMNGPVHECSKNCP